MCSSAGSVMLFLGLSPLKESNPCWVSLPDTWQPTPKLHQDHQRPHLPPTPLLCPPLGLHAAKLVLHDTVNLLWSCSSNQFSVEGKKSALECFCGGLQDMQWQDQGLSLASVRGWSPAMKGLAASGALLVAALLLGATRRVVSGRQQPM